MSNTKIVLIAALFFIAALFIVNMLGHLFVGVLGFTVMFVIFIIKIVAAAIIALVLFWLARVFIRTYRRR